MTPDWTKAACAHADPDIFLPSYYAEALKAIRVCRGCPIIHDCLEWALAHPDLDGVYGGTTTTERLRIAGRSKVRKGRQVAPTERTETVAAMARSGVPVPQIAEALGLSRRTVERHLVRARDAA